LKTLEAPVVIRINYPKAGAYQIQDEMAVKLLLISGIAAFNNHLSLKELEVDSVEKIDTLES